VTPAGEKFCKILRQTSHQVANAKAKPGRDAGKSPVRLSTA